MYKVHYLNPISPKGTALWTNDYQKSDTADDAQAIMVRSAAMHDMPFSQNLLAVARAGAGVNNIPLERCAQEGIVVFNTPGANANGVVELALCGMLLGSRDIVDGINWVKTIQDDPDVAKKVEMANRNLPATRSGIKVWVQLVVRWPMLPAVWVCVYMVVIRLFQLMPHGIWIVILFV